MKKKLGIFLNNKGTSNVDVSKLFEGNPGMGGTQFEFFILLTELAKIGVYDIVFFATAPQAGLKNVHTEVVKDITEAFSKCNELKIDVLISRDGGKESIDVLKETKLIYWVHNFLPYSFCKIVGDNKKVKRVVFVSYQHRDFYLEMNIAKKADVIYNSFYVPDRINVTKKIDNTVVFVGNIVPIKKLHIVTEIWPSVVRNIPDAKLIVIGTGQTANRNSCLGPYGIAEAGYEKQILQPLIKNNLLNSVEFKGLLGSEKSDIIKNAKVAVAPNDKETFCISALEYILSGTPVVGVSKGGINDVVQNKKTGLLCKTKTGLKKNIVKVLKGKTDFKDLPSGIDYIKENFGVEPFVNNWIRVIEEVANDIPPRKIKVKKPYSDKFKFVGILFKMMRKLFHLPDRISRVGIVSKLIEWRHHE